MRRRQLTADTGRSSGTSPSRSARPSTTAGRCSRTRCRRAGTTPA